MNMEAKANILFSDSRYSELIEIKPYLMNSAQVGQLFQSINQNICQPSYEKLNMNELYLVVMIKNKGNKTAWGILKCFVEQRELAQIDVPAMGGNMTTFVYFVVPIHGVIFAPSEEDPVVNLSWIKLYAK